MRVLFNVESLLAPPLTGVGHYARNTLDGLLETPELEVVGIARGREVPLPPRGYAPPAGGGEPPMTALRRARQAVGQVPGVRRAYAGALSLADWATRRRVPGDVYHDPNHLLRPMGCPGVVTMHDLSVLHFPEFHPPERVRAMGGAMRRAAADAARIICGAAFIKRDIERTLGVPGGRVSVVPYGVGPEFRPLGAAAAPVLAGYGLRRGGYVLAVGTREPRKNLERLLEAFLSLPEPMRRAFPLILVGPAGWRASRIEEGLDRAERNGEVRRLGYVPDGHRAALYSGAACFAYPSLYEGFGLPPLEAAACGVPVVTSRDSPMEEVVGPVAVLVDPGEVDAIAAGLRAVLDDPGAMARALATGPARAVEFTWARSVAGTVAVYRAASGAAALLLLAGLLGPVPVAAAEKGFDFRPEPGLGAGRPVPPAGRPTPPRNREGPLIGPVVVYPQAGPQPEQQFGATGVQPGSRDGAEGPGRRFPDRRQP